MQVMNERVWINIPSAKKEAESVFNSGRLLLQEDVKHGDAEPRFQALGETPAKRLLHVTFTLRGEGTLIRVISARDVNAKERASYDKEA
jgi:hypothetical protein